MKGLRKILVATFVLVLVASVLVFCLSIEAQDKVTQPWFTCVFQFKQGDRPQPLTRIYVHVQGRTEGEASINAHKYLSEKLTIAAQEQIEFIEAQNKGETPK